MEKFYKVGTIVNTQGLQGEVRVLPSTDFANERFSKGAVLALFDDKDNYIQDLKVKSGRLQKNFYVVKFEGFYHINDVEKYKGCALLVSADDLEELDENEFYYFEIIGCQVVTTDGETIGEISEILETGANDVWVVKRPGQKDALIPYIEDVVKAVDIETKQVTIQVLEGLL